jgi:hypothetical protein
VFASLPGNLKAPIGAYTAPSAVAAMLEVPGIVTGLPVEATVRGRADFVFEGTLKQHYDRWDKELLGCGGLLAFAREAELGALELSCIVCRFKF